MQTWDLTSLDVQPQQPEVISTEDEGRAIVIALSAGDKLGDHQVHERATVFVVSGQVEFEDSTGETVSGGAGLLAVFDPKERHEVRAAEDSRVLLLLSPWPGSGHPSERPAG
jgi:quercetin dioxygenase-like cupin family protein